MKRSLFIALLITSGNPAVAQHPEPFDVAITVDDLPAHGPLPKGTSRLAIAEAYLKTLRAHHVPEAFGFVNTGKLEAGPDSEAVLAAWRRAGYPLGNHGVTHLNLDRAASLAAWQADVTGGEDVIARHMRGADWRWYRFPNLAAGSTLARHDAADAYLHDRGYRIAQVGIAFSDWSYTDAYVRCLTAGDGAAIAAMKAAYLDGVDAGIARMRKVSMRVYGRMVPQVLLTHLGAWSAATLPDVLRRLDAAGARYVTLAKAQADPAYAGAQVLPGGGGIMDRTAKARAIDLTDLSNVAPTPAPKSFCAQARISDDQ